MLGAAFIFSLQWDVLINLVPQTAMGKIRGNISGALVIDHFRKF